MTKTSSTADLPPSFRDAGEFRFWLERAPKTDPARMQAMLLREITLLNRAVLPPGERLELLESLRDTLSEAQEGSSRKFAGKPLPLTPAEQEAFDSCRTLWHGLAIGYMRCLDACRAGDSALRGSGALILQRALAALVAEQYDGHRTGQAQRTGHWRLLHDLLATAEELGVADEAVEDRQRLGKMEAKPATTYAEAMLLQAANLGEHSQRHLGWIARWARRWSGKIRIFPAPPTLSTKAIPLCVDLAVDKPAGYMPLTAPGARWLETSALQRSLKKRLQLLEQGTPPAKLNLGDDCTQPACEQVLGRLYQRWCKGGAIRGFERRSASGSCCLVAGIEAIHYYLSGQKPFKQPGGASIDTLRNQREEIATFGRISAQREENFSEQHGYALEQWQMQENWHMVDSSSAGMRIARGPGDAGARIAQGQLIAACPDDAQSFLLGGVRWALVENDLQLGIFLFPGQPQPVAFRGTEPGTKTESFRQAFLLPAVATLKQDASIFLPVGSFKLKRVLEIYGGQSYQLRLIHLVERGSDYERATFESL